MSLYHNKRSLVITCLLRKICETSMARQSEKKFKLGMTAKKILENNKGILAADESPNTIQKRFDKNGIANTEETRRKFRELLFKTDGIENFIGGIILHEETFEQVDSSGKALVGLLREKGISIGIKLDKGLINFKGDEKISVGIEDLKFRICKFAEQGAEFAKWRSLFIINEFAPTEECIVENCNVLAEYAKTCQDFGLVPIVEPEVFFEGVYSIDVAEKQTTAILSTLIQKLNLMNVYIPAVIIKMSFVTPGSEFDGFSCTREIADRTLNALISTVPCGISGIVFLSGGHSQEDSINYLNAVNMFKACTTWSLSFSFGRCLTEEPMKIWGGKDENAEEASEAFLQIAEKCHKACKGAIQDD